MAASGSGSSAADTLEDEFHNAAAPEDQRSQHWLWQRVLRSLITLDLLEFLPPRFTGGQSSAELRQEDKERDRRRARAGATAQKPVPIFGHWAFWAIVLAATLVTWDPLQIRQMVALYKGFKLHECQNLVDCCRPVPDIDEWPADPVNKLLDSQLFSNTVIPGPETLVWDLQVGPPQPDHFFTGRGPYTGVADGRIIRWNESDKSWETFAYISPYWTEELCTYQDWDSHDLEIEQTCGRPLGMKFHPISGSLFIADAYFGLAMVGSEGGQADILSNESEGVTHKFTNDLDIHEDGTVYFTVSSLRRPRSECQVVVIEADNTGRLVKYDPITKNTTLLLWRLRYPNGLAISKDGAFLLIASTTTNRIWKYWLQGLQAGIREDFAYLPGYPDNIRSTEDGDFWVAIHSRRTNIHVWLCKLPWASKMLFPIQQTYKSVARFISGRSTPMAIKYNTNGEAIDILEDRTRTSHTQFLSNVQERDGRVWLTSVFNSMISVYSIPPSTSI